MPRSLVRKTDSARWMSNIGFSPTYPVLMIGIRYSLVVNYLNGNVELIQMLNRRGHCVSYAMTEQIKTAYVSKRWL